MAKPDAWQYRYRSDGKDWGAWGPKQSALHWGGYGREVEQRPLYAEVHAPMGWQLVPKEPTEAMIEAHFAAHARADTVFADVKDIWRAMLSASPTAGDK